MGCVRPNLPPLCVVVLVGACSSHPMLTSFQFPTVQDSPPQHSINMKHTNLFQVRSQALKNAFILFYPFPFYSITLRLFLLL